MRFISVPKTACSTVRRVLAHLHGNTAVDIIITAGHVPLAYMVSGGGFSVESLTQEYVCAGIRNPWDRLVSGYCHAKYHPREGVARHMRGFKSFAEFASWVVAGNAEPLVWETRQGQWANPQVCWYVVAGTMLVDHLIRFEHLADDVAVMYEHFGLPGPLVPHINKGTHRKADYREHYTPGLARDVGDYYKADCELGEYEF